MPLTSVQEFLSSHTSAPLLRTPCAAEDGGGPLHPDTARAKGQTLRLTGQILALTGHLLPTHHAGLGAGRGSQAPAKREANGHAVSLPDTVEHVDMKEYTPGVSLWEKLSNRNHPSPILPTGRKGKMQLSAQFVEWMMGLPAGWVTDIAIKRNEQLKALGNGVVPQQAAFALADMKSVFDKESK